MHRSKLEVVESGQRRRLLAAAARALAEHGYVGMTVGHVLNEAGASRSTFYAYFENKQECVLLAHEAAFERFAAALFRACARESEWPAKVVAAVSLAIEFAVERPEEARLLIVDSVAAEPVLVKRVLAFGDFLVAILRNGRERCPRAASMPPLTEQALVGAASALIGGRLLSGEASRLPSLEPQLVQFFLMPYLGIDEARRVAKGDR